MSTGTSIGERFEVYILIIFFSSSLYIPPFPFARVSVGKGGDE